MLFANLSAMVGKVNMHIVRQLCRVFYRCSDILPVVRSISGFFKKFPFGNCQAIFTFLKASCRNFNKVTVKAIPIFLFQNYISGIIQCHNGRRIVERNGIEIINVLTIR